MDSHLPLRWVYGIHDNEDTGMTTLTRRQALIAVLTTFLAQVNLKAQASTLPASRAVLVIDLTQWKQLIIVHEGRQVEFSSTEVFDILRGKK